MINKERTAMSRRKDQLEAIKMLGNRRDYIKSVVIPENKRRIAAAIALGGIEDNASYDAAKIERMKLCITLWSIEEELMSAGEEI